MYSTHTPEVNKVHSKFAQLTTWTLVSKFGNFDNKCNYVLTYVTKTQFRKVWCLHDFIQDFRQINVKTDWF